jgi:hypothetical protein
MLKGGSKMSRCFRVFFAFTLAAAVLCLFRTPAAWAESYTSEDYQYSDHFPNDWYDDFHNDLQHMDAVYFGGREIVFFTLESTYDSTDIKNLFFFTYGADYHGTVNISNSNDLNYRFKTVEFNSVLYIFYTTDSGSSLPGVIAYQTVTGNFGTPDQPAWSLQFSGMKSIFTGASLPQIRMAFVINEILYVFFSSDSYWYYISSTDGVHFSAPTALFMAGDAKGAGGAVFSAPDPTEGMADKLMIAYATGSAVKYYFFDGNSLYGDPNVGNGPYVIATPGLSPYSVQLIAGSAQGYSDSLYSIQAFIACPIDPTNLSWYNIYHREYIPAGDTGYHSLGWSATWTQLANSGEDAIHGSDNWAVISSFTSQDTDPASDVQSNLRIWYSRGTHYTWPSKDWVEFRCSYYQSDILVHQPQLTAGPEVQDLSTETVIGVIEGTPPWPHNGGGGHNDTSNTSWVEFGKSDTEAVDTNWSVGGSITAYIGHQFRNPKTGKKTWNVKLKLSAGVKYTKISNTSGTTSKGIVLKTYNDVVPGELGWVVVLIPEILNDPYTLKAYDRHALAYSGDTSGDELSVSLIRYGQRTKVDLKAYYLDNPSGAIGGDEQNNSRKILDGMAARPLDDDITGDGTTTFGWRGATDYYTKNARTGSNPNGPFSIVDLSTLNDFKQYVDLQLWSTLGESAAYSLTASTTDGHTWSPSASFSVSVDKLGFINFGGEAAFNFSADIKTTSTMTTKLGFQYNIPDCCNPKVNDCTGYTCYSTMEVVPKLLVPADDDTGYNAPWISNDIRNFEKPKPWCLSYMVYPQLGSPAAASSRLTVKNASATLLLNRTKPNADRVSAKITLQGVGADFFEQLAEFTDLSLGSYVANSYLTPVLSSKIQGSNLVLQLQQAANPNSSVQITLSYNQSRSLLNIGLDARRLNLPGMYDNLKNAYSAGQAIGLPFGFFAGSGYYAEDTFAVRLTTVNKDYIICEVNKR